jgi:hypothetical protein
VGYEIRAHRSGRRFIPRYVGRKNGSRAIQSALQGFGDAQEHPHSFQFRVGPPQTFRDQRTYQLSSAHTYPNQPFSYRARITWYGVDYALFERWECGVVMKRSVRSLGFVRRCTCLRERGTDGERQDSMSYRGDLDRMLFYMIKCAHPQSAFESPALRKMIVKSARLCSQRAAREKLYGLLLSKFFRGEHSWLYSE